MQIDHGFFQRGILRILIKLATRQLRFERRAGKIKTSLLDPHMFGKDPRRIEINHVFLIDRPVFLRLESQLLIAIPSPRSGDFRVDHDTRTGGFADHRDRRGRAGKTQ